MKGRTRGPRSGDRSGPATSSVAGERESTIHDAALTARVAPGLEVPARARRFCTFGSGDIEIGRRGTAARARPALRRVTVAARRRVRRTPELSGANGRGWLVPGGLAVTWIPLRELVLLLVVLERDRALGEAAVEDLLTTPPGARSRSKRRAATQRLRCRDQIRARVAESITSETPGRPHGSPPPSSISEARSTRGSVVA